MYAASFRGRGALNGRESLGRGLAGRQQESGWPCYTLLREEGQQAWDAIDVDGQNGTRCRSKLGQVQGNAGPQLVAVLILAALGVGLGVVDIQRRNNVAVCLIMPVRMPVHMRAQAAQARQQAQRQQDGGEAREHQRTIVDLD